MFSSAAARRTVDFDFTTFAETLDQTGLLLRDDAQGRNYHAGVAGFSTSVADTVGMLDVIREDLGAEHVVTVGVSLGGYAAVLYGLLIGADICVAMDAVSFVDPAIKARYGRGERLRGSFETTRRHYTDRGATPRYLDLLDLAEDRRRTDTVVRWHFSGADPIDRLHAEHAASLPGIDVLEHPALRRHGRMGIQMVLNGALAREIDGTFVDP